MKEYKKLKSLADKIFKASKADQTEVLFANTNQLLTRFSKNSVHQNVMTTDNQVFIRVIKGKRIGSASTNRIDSEGLIQILHKAIEIANLQKVDEKFQSLPYEKECIIEENPVTINPKDLANKVETIIEIAVDQGVDAFGAVKRENGEIEIFNSLGTSSYRTSTLESLNLVMMNGELSGYGALSAKNLEMSDIERIALNASKKCKSKYAPVSVNPGRYDVFLEEYAVITMLMMLNYMGFSGLKFLEGRSFLSGKIGKKITGNDITIYDDGMSEKGLPTYFDFEGKRKKKVVLIEKGIGKAVVYDSYTANLGKTKNTGHSLPQPNLFGPYCLNIFMKSGNADVNDMISSIKRGIYVTRFHYVNVVHPRKTIMTGMTRDGTFLIENGEITKPIKNLRFTQSILEAFKNAKMLSKKTKLLSLEGESYVAPAILVKGFNFTGVSEM